MKSLTDPTTSVLNSVWTEPARPYSHRELHDSQKDFLHHLRLSRDWVHHSECGHRYFVKHNGVKHKLMLEASDRNVGNCSVCWKLRQTPDELIDCAYMFVDSYMDLGDDPERPPLDVKAYEITKIYYTWLYVENFK